MTVDYRPAAYALLASAYRYPPTRSVTIYVSRKAWKAMETTGLPYGAWLAPDAGLSGTEMRMQVTL